MFALASVATLSAPAMAPASEREFAAMETGLSMEEIRRLPWAQGRIAVLEALEFEVRRSEWLFVGSGPRRAQAFRTALCVVRAMSPREFRLAKELATDGLVLDDEA